VSFERVHSAKRSAACRAASLVGRCLVLLVIAGGGTIDAHGQAQDDPAAIVRSEENQSAALAAAWLGSSEARTRAWGAYLALRDRRRELLPQLIGLVDVYSVTADPRSSAERDDHDLMLGALDAIIQMDRVEGVQETSGLSVLPPEKAARLYPEFPAQALILLARGGPAASIYLLNIFKDGSGSNSAWVTAGNLLVHWKPAGFAAEVLRDFTFDVRVCVTDDDSCASGGIGVGVGGSCSSGGPSPRPGWPPVGNYFLGRGNGVFLAGGADRSSYIRTVGPADDDRNNIESRCTFFLIDRNVARGHFLADLIFDPPENPSVRSSVTRTITWRNNDLYQSDLRLLIRQQQNGLDRLIQRLMNAGLLGADEIATARPSLEVRISDLRSSRPSDLPALRDAGSNVKFLN
jgi:hypothetical protein